MRVRLLAGALALAGLPACSRGPTEPPPPGVTALVEAIPATAFLRPNSHLALQARALDRDSAPVPDREVSWTTSSPGVATVDATGLVTTGTPGHATITATIDGVRSRVHVEVAEADPVVPAWSVVSRGLSEASLLGVWMASDSEGWAVGQAGTVLHTVDGGATWARETVPTTVALTGIWGSDRNNIWIVGEAGWVLRYNGTTWSRVPVPSGNPLLEVWGLGPNAVYIVGVGIAMRYDGVAWQVMPMEQSAELWGIWGTSPSNLHAVGQDGVIMRWDGNTWRRVASPFSELLLGIWGASASEAWAVGIQGAILRWNGAGWSRVPSPSPGPLFAVWGRTAGEVWAVGNHGLVLRWNGVTWTLVPQLATGQNLRAVHGAGTSGVVAAGWSGTLIHRVGGTWQPGPSGPGLFDSSTEYIVGSGGTILRRTGDLLTREVVPTLRDLYGIGVDAQGVLVVGDTGTVLRRHAGGWSLVPSTTSRLLRSVWVPPDGDDATIVGEGGIILRVSGNTLVPEASGTQQFLRWTWGLSSNDRFAVGDGGVILRNRGRGWESMPTPSSTRLRAIWGTGPTNIFAAGDNGVVMRHDGERWYLMQPPVAVEWRALWGTGPSDVYLVGDGGVILHFDGATWRQRATPTTDLLLSIRPAATPGAFQVVGTRAVVLEGR